MTTVFCKLGRFFVYYYFQMNILRWCLFVYLFDTPFQNSPYGHVLIYTKTFGFTGSSVSP